VHDFVLAQRPDFSLLIGSEQLMAECIPQGAHGGVCGGANVFPRLFVELYDAAVAGDAQRVEALQARVLRLAVTIYAVGNAGYAAIRGIKGALAYLGICNDFVASPLQVLNDHERHAIALHLSDQELLIQDESVRAASMRIAAS
jgi:4-hydroxy-tetrahydrodipicolinate synthase